MGGQVVRELYKRIDGRVHGVRFVNVRRHDHGLWSEAVEDLRRLRAGGIVGVE